MSVRIEVPCGPGVCAAELPERGFLGVFRSRVPAPAPDPDAEVARALDAPIGSPRLEELASGARTATIICSDHTRPVPSRYLVPALLRRLRAASPDVRVTLLVATGCHRGTTRAELVAKFGEEIVERERIVVHDCADEASLVSLGTLPSGGELRVNRAAVETDLLLSEGFIEPHFFAGYSGGRKSVLPGIAGRVSVLANHCAEFIADPKARTGVLDGNPIHRDMLWAARAARLAFVLNVVIDGGKRIVRAFAGDPDAAHRAGAAFLDGFARIDVPEADVCVTGNGGAPLDQNVYQCVKGMSAAESVVRPGGAIVLCAECADGHGGRSFFEHLRDFSARELLAQCAATPRDATVPDQWQYQIAARIMDKAHVVFVSPPERHAELRAMRFEAAATLPEGLALARRLCGDGDAARVAVLPDGVSVVPVRA